jgi:Fe-S-cluster-containing hydrogenase component 2
MINSKKCTGCHMCELACSAYHEGAFRPSVARLFAEVNPTTVAIKGHTCLQTGCSKCEEICPQQAIFRQEITVTVKGDFDGKEKIGGETVKGLVLKVDESKCTNCGECYDVCPTGVIHEHPERAVAYKCDLCDGQPQCIAFCQNPHVLAVDLKVDKADRALVEA